MRKRIYLYKDEAVEWLNKEDDFRSIYGSENLVHYGPGNDFDFITVDESQINEEYSWYASIHECICCGRYSHMAPATKDSLDRCGLIDIELLDYMLEENSKEYRERRIDMFKTLLEKNLNSAMNESFKRSLEMLENYKIE